MKKSFVIKKSFIIICLFILLLPFSLMSQTPQIEWDLMPGDSCSDELDLLPVAFLETMNDDYIVSLMHSVGAPFSDDKNKSNGKNNVVKILKLDNNGELLQETEIQYDENYLVNEMKFDVWNDTINVFTLLNSVDGDQFVLMHAYLFDDLSVCEQKVVWRKEFNDGLERRDVMQKFEPLIDENGCRTFHIEYSTSRMSSDYVVHFFKLDDKYNIIAECEYDRIDDLNNDISGSCPLMYNADSTQYYYISYTSNSPYYHFMNVFDMDLNLTEQIRLDSDPPVYLQATHGYWCQNPYNAKIYCLGQVTVPNMMYQDIVAFKIDIDNDKVDFLRLSYSPDEIRNVVVLDKNLCFFPDGKIFGCAVYDVELFDQYKPGAYLAYIPVFDINMKKESEWYYSIGYEYNQFMYQIDRTKDNGIILMGYERFKIDEEILWEPYIVKFPASAFDPDNIEEAHAHGLHLAVAYPNPGGDVMNIRTALRNATLSVYDMQGRIVHEQEITDDVTSIDASRWNSGTYIWKLTINNEQLTVEEVESGKWVKD